MDNPYFNYQTTVAYHQARFGLAQPFQSFLEWLASANAAKVITTTVIEKRIVDQTEKKSHNSENSDYVQIQKILT